MAEDRESNHAQIPLRGVVLCCTSIPPDKVAGIEDMAFQMGAVTKRDLTSDVTHLIVGDTGTPKYRFVARERPDVKCLLPTWIDAVRQSWMDGGETDVEALEVAHRLPTFEGLTICVTGFDDLAHRKELEDLVNCNGGEYRGNLTRDITHLIAKVPSGTKYKYATEWGIKVVAVEWLVQSLERGMILDENLYNLQLAASERGQNAWIRKTESTSSLGKRARGEENAPRRSRKLRRTASAKLSSQNMGLWTDIVGGGTEATDNKVNEWDDQQRDDRLNDGVMRVENLGQDSTKTMNKTGNPGSASLDEDTSNMRNKLIQSRSGQKEGLFQGNRFFLHGFNERQSYILQNHLQSHRGEIVQDILELLPSSTTSSSGYILVSHTTAHHDIPRIPRQTVQLVVVTDMWVERCLHRQSFIEPQANVTNIPFLRFPIAGFERLVISSTAFQGVDLLHLSKAAKLMGATYSEFFTPNSSVLVCNAKSPSAEKLHHALRWKVPIVTADWIWDCIREGELKSFKEYLIQVPRQQLLIEDLVRPAKASASGRESVRSRRPLTRNGKIIEAPQQQRLEKLKQNLSTSSLNDTTKGILRQSPSTTGESSQQRSETVREHEPEKETLMQENKSYDTNSDTLRSTSAPLREVSFNASPKPPSPVKSPSPPPPKPVARLEYEEDSLGPAISSLLAHHQRSSAGSGARSISEKPALGRRRRELLGRATSNLSMRSNGSIGISRASSVDTVNTDGLGTPLESSNAATGNEGDSLAALLGYDERKESHQSPDDYLQMTQLGYEDPNVQAWRDRVVKKMGGVTEVGTANPEGVGIRVKSIGVVKDVMRKGAQGVAKRTRQAMARS